MVSHMFLAFVRTAILISLGWQPLEVLVIIDGITFASASELALETMANQEPFCFHHTSSALTSALILPDAHPASRQLLESDLIFALHLSPLPGKRWTSFLVLRRYAVQSIMLSPRLHLSVPCFQVAFSPPDYVALLLEEAQLCLATLPNALLLETSLSPYPTPNSQVYVAYDHLTLRETSPASIDRSFEGELCARTAMEEGTENSSSL